MYTQILIYKIKGGVPATRILYMPFEMKLANKFQITLEEYRSEELNLVISTVIKKSCEESKEICSRDSLGVQIS